MNRIFIVLVVALAHWAAPASAQQTGLEALAALARAKGGAVENQVVLLAGSRGSEQPDLWRVVARDPAIAGQFREYGIRGRRVVMEQAVPVAEAGGYARAALVRSKVKVDSHVVFWRAHTEALKVLIGFDEVDYELRNAEFSTTPVWVVRLRNLKGVQVGELAVSAESGNVLRRTWFEAGRQPAGGAAPVSSPQRNGNGDAISETAQKAWTGTRNGWNEGTKAMKTGFRKASTTVGGWLLRAGGESPPPPPASAPTPPPAPTSSSTKPASANPAAPPAPTAR